MLRQTDPWSDLVWHWCPMLFSFITDWSAVQTTPAPKDVFCFEHVLTLSVHACEACTCNKQPLGNILTVIHGSVLSAKKCWPLLSSMEKLHNPYGFPNYELFPSGYAKSMLLSHPYPNIVLFLYCTRKRLFAMHSFQRQLSASAEAL